MTEWKRNRASYCWVFGGVSLVFPNFIPAVLRHRIRPWWGFDVPYTASALITRRARALLFGRNITGPELLARKGRGGSSDSPTTIYFDWRSYGTWQVLMM